MGVVFVQETGERVFVAAFEHGPEMLSEAGEHGVHVKGSAGDGVEAGDLGAQGRWGVAGVEIDVEADADEVGFVDAFTQEAGEFAAVIEQIVGPFEGDGGLVGDFGGGAAGGESCDEG